jgi:hypothetical protein
MQPDLHVPHASDTTAPSVHTQVYLDIGIAPTALKPSAERTLGSKTSIPLEDAAPAGRIVIGLYGNHVPFTVGNFLELVRSGALVNTVFSRVLPGEYIQAGQQGSMKFGQLEPPAGLKVSLCALVDGWMEWVINGWMEWVGGEVDGWKGEEWMDA